MSGFRRVPADDQLQAAEEAAMQAEAKIAQLVHERSAKLADGEGGAYLKEVAALDVEIGRLRASAAVHVQRMEAMKARRAREVRARLEQEKAAGIAVARKLLAKRLDAARKLDAGLKAVTEAFAELVAADAAVAESWPASVSALGLLAHFRLEAFEPLSARRIRRPPSAGLVRQLAEHEPFDIAEVIEARNREAIEMLESAPVSQIEEAA